MRAMVTTLAIATLLVLGAPLVVAEAQPARPVYRIGVLLNAAPHIVPGYEVFADALRDAGYVQGRNLELIVRHTDRYEQLPQLAADLVGMKPDVLVTFGTPTTTAAKRATQTIPIVGAAMGDPETYVAGLGRPGGNITGLSSVDVALAEKKLDLVKQAVPKLTRIAVLWNPLNPAHPAQLQAMKTAAGALGLTLRPVEVRGPDQLQTALDAIATRERVEALVPLPDGVFGAHRRSLIDFATIRRLPLVGAGRHYAEEGALMSLGADFRELWRHAVVYVDKILKGAKPSDLPVAQPTKYELVINLKTAKAIGHTIPPSLLLRADKVIQ